MATWAAVGAMVVLVASSVLLLLEVIPFTAQAAASIPALAIIFGWLLLVGRAALISERLPAPLSKAAVTIGAGLLAALAAVGTAALLPAASEGQRLLGGAGLTLGVAAFGAYHLWLLRLARCLRDTPTAVATNTHHAPQPAKHAPPPLAQPAWSNGHRPV